MSCFTKFVNFHDVKDPQCLEWQPADTGWEPPACNLITTGQERILFSSHKTLFSNDPNLTWSGPCQRLIMFLVSPPHLPPDYW